MKLSLPTASKLGLIIASVNAFKLRLRKYTHLNTCIRHQNYKTITNSKTNTTPDHPIQEYDTLTSVNGENNTDTRRKLCN